MKNLPLQLSVREASELYNIPQNTLRAYIHRRLIPFRKVKGRVYLVTETLSDWLSSFDVEPRLSERNDNE